MTVKLLKTKTFVYTTTLIQIAEDGKQVTSKLRVRFNAIPRTEWDALQTDPDDARLMYDVAVAAIEDKIEVDERGVLSPEQALAEIREDLSLTGQIVDQFIEVAFGASAKNARRSRAR